MGCGPSGVLSAPPARTLETRIVQDDVVDTLAEEASPDDVTRERLPEGDFIDGRLGVAVHADVDAILRELPEGHLFRDPDFPADITSLTCSETADPELSALQWRRPHELSDDPHMFVDGASRSDVRQGALGDCWFLCACASVARRQDLIEKVVPPEQPLHGDGYQGIVAVHLWRFGEWLTVLMDDMLPVKGEDEDGDGHGHLYYGSCAHRDEFWLPFVEKAYAKLHGSYEALAGGHAIEAFVDLTGGLAEELWLASASAPADMFAMLRTAFSQGAFITCARKGDDGQTTARSVDTGLVRGHAYTVTDVRRVRVPRGDTLRMVRVRNPWADDCEWTGAWSDQDPRWESLDADTVRRLRPTAAADGEFWMQFADFQEQFDEVTVATMGPDFDRDGRTDIPKQVQSVHGCWREGETAGGCRNDLEMFATNPQYVLTLTETDDPDPDSDDPPRCSILVGLMQEHRRSERNRELRMLAIAFFVYKTDTPNERLSAEYFLCVPEEGSSGAFTNSREVLARLELEPGAYTIIPATFYPNRSRNFMLRVFALKPFVLQTLPDCEILLHEQDMDIKI